MNMYRGASLSSGLSPHQLSLIVSKLSLSFPLSLSLALCLSLSRRLVLVWSTYIVDTEPVGASIEYSPPGSCALDLRVFAADVSRSEREVRA